MCSTLAVFALPAVGNSGCVLYLPQTLGGHFNAPTAAACIIVDFRSQLGCLCLHTKPLPWIFPRPRCLLPLAGLLIPSATSFWADGGILAALPFAGLLLPWTTSFWADGGILDLGLESDLSDPVLVLPPLAPNRSPVEKIGHDQEDGG